MVDGESFIRTWVIFGDTNNSKNSFRGFAPELTVVDIFRLLLGFELCLPKVAQSLQ